MAGEGRREGGGILWPSRQDPGHLPSEATPSVLGLLPTSVAARDALQEAAAALLWVQPSTPSQAASSSEKASPETHSSPHSVSRNRQIPLASEDPSFCPPRAGDLMYFTPLDERKRRSRHGPPTHPTCYQVLTQGQGPRFIPLF